MFEWFKNLGAKKPQQEVQSGRYPEPSAVKTLPSPSPVPVRHVGFIITQDGISLVLDGKPHSIGKSHMNYAAILAALKTENYDDLAKLIDVPTAVKNQTKGTVTVNEYGEVFHNGSQVHGVISERIAAFVREQLPFEPLTRFLENLMLNPNTNSVEQLYAFLEHGGFPITPDGCFLAYKGVTDDFKDCHTRSFDNSIGAKQNMDRSLVDPNPNAACSTGFHVGTHEYATGFVSGGGKVVMVKVNPANAVSVPEDHSCQKLRVCDYEVVAMCPGKIMEPLSKVGYIEHMDGEEDDGFEDWNDDAQGGCEEITESEFEEATTAVSVQAPKRAACSYCGAKGGKKHKRSCKRPKKK